ncbi:Phe-sensitive (3-deoxy-D-arabino-heptulosonate 7-phosphate synthase) (DAHP synthase) (Phospho-2-keto-3-deoxyheptonate aldolase) [Durusdinium trenchii]|uniref:3-deoxy-7-phosphoheptulonate synthase n=1 Tax=Durusdinium trenchii TaxID=1381693 RepID=A0ABP0IMT5_9DINO
MNKRRKFSESMAAKVDDVRIEFLSPLLPPACLIEDVNADETVVQHVSASRQAVHSVVGRKDDRVIVVVGPCSVHDVDACNEYAVKLAALSKEVANEVLVVMRVYFEKPRTTVGWKGLINDPELNGSFKINKGLRMGREFLLAVNKLGLPAGVEFLDTLSPQFIGDLVSWGAIGARTTESQVHRELASGLSCPVGFKNGTGGDVKVALDACGSAANPHSFLSVTKQGLAAIVHTKGNEGCHVILRGGSDGPNYDAENVKKTAAAMEKAGLQPRIMIDCSHGNSRKQHSNQPIVAEAVCEQIAAGEESIIGLMIESHLEEA